MDYRGIIRLMQSIFPDGINAFARNVFSRARRYPRAMLFLAFALCFLPVYASMLTGFNLYVPGDTLGFNYPPLKALQPFSISSLLSDPYSGRGFPWVITYGTLDPIAQVLRLFFNEYLTFAWLCYVYHVFGGWLFSLFLRRHALSDGAAFIGGLVYAAAFFWVGNADYPLAFSLPLFAGLLYASSFVRTHPLWSCVGMSIGIGYGWVAGHFNFVPFAVVMLAVITCAIGVRARGESLGRRLQPFLLFCIATGVGTMIGLVKLVPALAYVSLSERAGGLSLEAAGKAALTLSTAFTALFPYMTVPLLPGEIGLLFFGATGLALTIVAIFQRDRSVRPVLWALLVCLIIVLPHSPLYAAFQSLPFFSFLRVPRRWLILTNVCVGFLAAAAADRVQAGHVRYVRGTGRMLWVIGIVTACASLAVTLADVVFGESIIGTAQNYFDTHLYGQTSGLPIAHYHRHIERLWNDAVLNVSLFSLPFLIPLAGLLLTGWFMRGRIARGEKVMQTFVGLTAFTLVPIFFFHQPIASFDDLHEAQRVWSQSDIGENSVLPILSGQADQIFRTGVVGDIPHERVRYQIGLLVPNTQALVNVHSVDFYQPLQSRRIGSLLASLGSTSARAPADEYLALAKITPEEKIQIIARRLPLLQRLGVRYVSSVWDIPSPFILAESLSFVSHLPDIQLYRLPDTRPYAYIASFVRMQNPDEDAAVAYLRDAESVDPSLIECNQCIYGERAQAAASVTVQDRTAVSTTAQVSAQSDVMVNILQLRMPGWRAYIDGTPVKTAIADAVFFAVPVPAGRHDVRLEITYRTLFIDSLRLLLTREDPWLL